MLTLALSLWTALHAPAASCDVVTAYHGARVEWVFVRPLSVKVRL